MFDLIVLLTNRLVHVKQRFPNTPVMALTATATPKVREDIITTLNLKKPIVFVASFSKLNTESYSYIHR
jgi:superfamily II DNA helicase RecQ